MSRAVCEAWWQATVFPAMKLPALLACLLALACGPARARVVNRWSFDNANGNAPAGTVIADSVSGAAATVRGTGSIFSNGALTLPGTTNGNHTAAGMAGYVDLPNGIISSKTNLTVEVWATPLAVTATVGNWGRVFDFGRVNTAGVGGGAAGEITGTTTTAPGATNASDNLMLSFCNGADLAQQRMEALLNGASTVTVNTTLATTAGTQYHYVLTFTDGAGAFGSAGGQMAWYRNGVLSGTGDISFHLASLEDVNNWLGRSQWSADYTAHASFNECRIYDHAMTAAQVAASYAAGPAAVFPAPATVADAVTLHWDQKVRIAVLANDSGDINPATVVIAQPPQYGTATVDSAGQILYAHTTGTPSADSFTYRVSGAGGQSAATTVTINFALGLRIANSSLNVPAAPPATAVQVVDGFPGATFTKPLCFVSPPGDTQRLFVCELGGKLKVIPDVTAATPTTSLVLDLVTVLATPPRTPAETLKPGNNDPECGLLGLAFHPNYAANGYFYVLYTVGKATDTGAVWYERLARFTVPAAQRLLAAPVADPASEFILLEQRDREDNHNGGDLHFGADGYLYCAFGDEGNPNDNWGNSQRIDVNFFSAMLRIDVDKKPGNLEPHAHPNPNAAPANAAQVPAYSSVNAIIRDSGVARYSIPIDNPFVPISQGGTWNGTFNGVALSAANLPYVRSEFWAVGLRSPWRFSFDAPTGDLWLGDVGQDTYEEVDLITRGGNYGWVYREGKHDTAFNTPTPPARPAGFSPTDPIWEYTHASNGGGSAVIGGVVYRGSRFASLTGAYIFGDQVSGSIWALTRPGGVATVQRIAGQAGLTTFGTDPSNGDVLVSDYNGGRVMRIITTTPNGSFPTTLSATGLFADLTDLSPAPGLLPYTPNLTFWSDYAVKRRWFIIPDAAGKMTWSRDGAWAFPSGEIWVKHFDLETERGNSASAKRRIETRVLVRNASGVYGVSYRWNDAQTDATLVADGGDDFAVNITVGGTPYAQPWRIPSRAQCVTCHSPQAGHALSFNTRQLNLANTINGFSGNQLDLLRTGGFFSNPTESPNVLPRHLRPDETAWPLEARVRSYFAVNCAYCHQAGGSGPSWDGRAELTLAQTGLINGAATSALHAGDQLVVPNDLSHSVAYNRIALTNGYTRMPPLASNELDQTAIALVANWITQSLPTRQTYAQWRLAQFGSSTSAAGDPAFDADADGRSNYDEFLASTNPRNSASFLLPQITAAGPNLTLGFNVPANRSFQIETSADLATWSLWNVPGNQGLPQPGGAVSITAPGAGPQQFFRLRLWEN